MAKKKYFIDIETISVSSGTKSSAVTRRVWIGGTGVSMILGILFAVFFFRFFSSPSEKKLQRQIDEYQIKYHILNTRINALMEGINTLEEKDDYTYRVIYELQPVPEDMRKAGIGGAVHYNELFQSDNTKIAGISMRNIDLAMRKMQIQTESFTELEDAAHDKENMLASIPTIMPVAKEKIRITSLFGWRKNPFNRRITSFHSGVDFAGKPGTPIYATGDGVVTKGTGRMQGYGIVVVVNHGYGYQTLYAHLSKAKVKPGEKVKRGQVIGTLGRTGSATGPHLHYEVIKNGQKVNPMNFITSTLTKEEYNQILEQAKELE
jgi:hypothetical protein